MYAGTGSGEPSFRHSSNSARATGPANRVHVVVHERHGARRSAPRHTGEAVAKARSPRHQQLKTQAARGGGRLGIGVAVRWRARGAARRGSRRRSRRRGSGGPAVRRRARRAPRSASRQREAFARPPPAGSRGRPPPRRAAEGHRRCRRGRRREGRRCQVGVRADGSTGLSSRFAPCGFPAVSATEPDGGLAVLQAPAARTPPTQLPGLQPQHATAPTRRARP